VTADDLDFLTAAAGGAGNTDWLAACRT